MAKSNAFEGIEVGTVSGASPVDLGMTVDKEFTEDFTDVVSGGLYDTGRYLFRCKSVDRTTAKTGNPQYEFVLKFEGGPYNNCETRVWASLQPNARWKVVEHLRAFGMEAAGSAISFKQSDIVGKLVWGDVIHSEYGDKVTAKVDKLYPYTGDLS